MTSSDSGRSRLALARATGRTIRSDPRLLAVLAAHVLYLFLVVRLGVGLFIGTLEQSLGRTAASTGTPLLDLLVLVFLASVGWVILRAIATALVGDALRTDVATNRDSTVNRLLQNSPTLLAFGLLQPVVMLCRFLDITRTGRRLTSGVFSDATATATAFVLPAATLDESPLGDAMRRSADTLRTQHNGPVTVWFRVLPVYSLYAIGVLIGGIGMAQNSHIFYDAGRFLSEAFYGVSQFLIVDYGFLTLTFLAIVLACTSLYRTVGTVGLYLGYTGRLDNTKLLPATPRDAVDVTELADYEFSYSALGDARSPGRSQDASPLSNDASSRFPSVEIPRMNVSLPSVPPVLIATRHRLSSGLRTVGTPLARGLFAADHHASRVVARLRPLAESRPLKLGALFGASVTTLVAILFVVLIILLGPMSAMGTVPLLGHDTHAVVDDESTVQPSYMLGRTLAGGEFESAVQNIRTEAGNPDTYGVSPSGDLQRAAARHTVEMAAMGEVTHESPDGLSPDERFARAGITCEKRWSTTSLFDEDDPRAGTTFKNTTPTELVGSYHYGLDKQYPLSNKNLPLMGSAPYGEHTSPWNLTNLDPRHTYETRERVEDGTPFGSYETVTKDMPVYDSAGDIGTVNPWTPDVVKVLTYTITDIVTDEDHREVLRNESYTHYGFYYHMDDDRTVYYTVVLC